MTDLQAHSENSSLITHRYRLEEPVIRKYYKLVLIAAFALGAFMFSFSDTRGQSVSPGAVSAIAQQNQPRHTDVKSESGNLVVQLCDGKTSMEVDGVREGEVLPPEKARAVAAKMMAAVAEQAKQTSKWTERDRLTWEREQKRMIEEGNKLFHDWKALGGTIGISCDMCHPNASNTHPETYPKFQTQIKKVVAVREMINWCIENPMKGKPLALDDPRLLAVESYIAAQRKGVPLDPGKH
jgi:thiosulfate dehydrogenase